MFFNKLVDVKLIPTGERVAAIGCPDHGTEQRHTALDENVDGLSLPTRASLATAEKHQARDKRMKATAQVIRTSEQPKRTRQVSCRGFNKGLHLKCGPLPITSNKKEHNMAMYQTLMEVTSDGPRRMLGSDFVVRVDGRLSVWRATQDAKAWAKSLAEFHHIKSYVVVLFSCATLARHWEYRAHAEVTGTATIPAIQAALN